jgi:hypothetical protein
MRERIIVLASILALGIAVFGLTAVSRSLTSATVESAVDGRSAKPAAAATPTNLSGHWELDREHSDMPQWSRGPRGERGADGDRMRRGDGERGAWRGRGDGRGPGGGMRRFRLPSSFHIDQSATMLKIADSSGTTVQEITTGRVSEAKKTDVPRVAGVWKQRVLEVKRETPRGTFTESYELAADGRSLVVRTTMAANGGGEPRQFQRVYRRVSGS